MLAFAISSCARLVRVQNLVLGTAALSSCRSLGGAVPALEAVAPLGKWGVFGRLFWDPTPPNLEFRIEKKSHPRQYGDLSNALSFVGRAPFLSGDSDRFWVTKVRSGQGSKQGTKQQQASKQQQQQQASITRSGPSNLANSHSFRARGWRFR